MINNRTISHKVIIKHPGDLFPQEGILYEVQNENAYPISYYMDVKSVICLEKVCKVIPVRIFWNEIGEYQKYELNKGATLEKYNNVLFEPADYKKLNLILLDKKSPYKGITIDDILKVRTSDSAGNVDAVSGASTFYIKEIETVQGAALTCYTLWHWANGDIVSIIKKNTCSSVSEGNLLDFLTNENHTYFFTAVEGLEERKIYSKVIVDTIVLQSLKNIDEFNAAIKYFEKAPSNIYFSTLKVLFLNGNENQKTIIIKSLLNTEYYFEIDYLDDFSEEIKFSKSFQVVSSFLDLVQTKKNISEKVIDNLMPLLDDDFLIARRTFYYLKNLNLNQNQLNKVDIFSSKHEGKL